MSAARSRLNCDRTEHLSATSFPVGLRIALLIANETCGNGACRRPRYRVKRKGGVRRWRHKRQSAVWSEIVWKARSPS